MAKEEPMPQFLVLQHFMDSQFRAKISGDQVPPGSMINFYRLERSVRIGLQKEHLPSPKFIPPKTLKNTTALLLEELRGTGVQEQYSTESMMTH